MYAVNVSLCNYCFTTINPLTAPYKFSNFRFVCQPVLLSLVTSLVLTRLDYGSVTLNGITKRLMDRLQSLLNAAARLVHNSLNTTAFHHFCATCTGCTSLNASSFVWPFSCSTKFSIFSDPTAPNYLARHLQWADTDNSWRRLRSVTTRRLLVHRT